MRGPTPPQSAHGHFPPKAERPRTLKEKPIAPDKPTRAPAGPGRAPPRPIRGDPGPADAGRSRRQEEKRRNRTGTPPTDPAERAAASGCRESETPERAHADRPTRPAGAGRRCARNLRGPDPGAAEDRTAGQRRPDATQPHALDRTARQRQDLAGRGYRHQPEAALLHRRVRHADRQLPGPDRGSAARSPGLRRLARMRRALRRVRSSRERARGPIRKSAR